MSEKSWKLREDAEVTVFVAILLLLVALMVASIVWRFKRLADTKPSFDAGEMVVLRVDGRKAQVIRQYSSFFMGWHIRCRVANETSPAVFRPWEIEHATK